MPTFIVTFVTGAGSGKPETIDAEYYRREDGWTTFKDAQHKVVHDIPDHVIKSIRRAEQENTARVINEVHIHGADQSAAAFDRIRSAAEAAAKRLGPEAS